MTSSSRLDATQPSLHAPDPIASPDPVSRLAELLGLSVASLQLPQLTDVLVNHVRRIGKHHLSVDVLNAIVAVRDSASMDAITAAFLNCLLDKRENRYDYGTYICLPLLELATSDFGGLDNRTMTRLLIADAIRFEVDTLLGVRDVLANQRPGPATISRRVRHGHRFVVSDPALSRRTVDLLNDGPEAVVQQLPPSPTGDVARILRLSVLPVDVLHDEFLFLRILQAYEMVFVSLCHDVQAATGAVRAGAINHSVELVDRAAAALGDSLPMFRMLATMDVAVFRQFRQFTEGASAIQSDRYKQFEVACSTPTPERLASAAFAHTAFAREKALHGGDTLADAYLDVTHHGTPSEAAVLAAALGRLEAAHQRWKTTHYSLAARMLGDAPGSGYTAGVPYLQEVRRNRLFPNLDDANDANGAYCATTPY